MNLNIYKSLVVLCILQCNFFFSNAQEPINNQLLVSKRRVFHTEIYKNGGLIGSKTIQSLYINKGANESLKKFNKARILLPASPVFIGGGFYLVYDAIKGTSMSVTIDGVDYDYKVRPIQNVIAGIGIFVVGICMLEYANEFKATSVDLYNAKDSDKKDSKVSKVSVGLTPRGGIGLSAKF